jgi:hypothetical protein
MKRIVILLGALLLLVGCSEDVKIHENVRTEIATDALQVVDVIVTNVENEIDYEDAEDKDVIDAYQYKYSKENSDFNRELYDGVNERVMVTASATVYRYVEGVVLDTQKEEIKFSKERLVEYITTGEE